MIHRHECRLLLIEWSHSVPGIFVHKIHSVTMLSVSLAITCLGAILEVSAHGHYHGMVVYISDIDHCSRRPADVDLKGVSTSDGRVVLPAKYAEVEYCGNGIFLATEPNKNNRYYFADSGKFFDLNGKELPYSLPPGAHLVHVLSFGEKSDRHVSAPLNELPSNTVLLFGLTERLSDKRSNKCNLGLCNINGRVILPAGSEEIRFLQPGKAFMTGERRVVVDLKSGNLSKTNLQFNPRSMPRARKKPEGPIPAMPDGFVRTVVSPDDGKFDKDLFNNRNAQAHHFWNMLNRFLHEHDLIGMSKAQVDELLGDGVSSDPERHGVKDDLNFRVYVEPRLGHAPCARGIKINFTDNHVVSWQFLGSSDSGPTRESDLITRNVVLRQPLYRKSGPRLVAGRIGEAGVGEPCFPPVIDKAESRYNRL